MLQVPLDRRHVARVHAPHLDIGRAQQVRGKPPELPLGTDVRTGAQQGPHTLFLHQPEELPQVAIARLKIPDAGLTLVIVPEDVGGNGVASHRLGHLDAMLPILLRDTGGMDLPTDDLKRVAIEEKLLLTESKRVSGIGGEGNRRGDDHGCYDTAENMRYVHLVRLS